jgi:hypothetical protein
MPLPTDIDAALAAVFGAPTPRGLNPADAAVIPQLLREVERGSTPEKLASYVRTAITTFADGRWRELPPLVEIVQRPVLVLTIEEAFRRDPGLGLDNTARLRLGRARFIAALMSEQTLGEPCSRGEGAKSEGGSLSAVDDDDVGDTKPLDVFMTELREEINA